MSDVLEKLEDVVDFLEHFGKTVDAKRIITLLKEEEDPTLSRICEEAKFTEGDYQKLSDLAIKSFWSKTLNVDTVTSLGEVIRSSMASRKRRRSIEREILRYWGSLPETPVENPSKKYHLFSVPNAAKETVSLLWRSMDVKLALKLLKDKGFVPAGLRELMACYRVNPKVYPPADWRDQHIDNGSLIAPGDCFAGKYPMIHIGAQMAKSWSRVPGDILRGYTENIILSPESDFLLMRKE